MTLYKNKYRIESGRLQKWDYSWPGYYFITICIKDRQCLFGKISNDKMELSDFGKIAEKYWEQIPEHFNNIKLDEYVIMPNHIHGILIIKNNPNNMTNRDSNHNVETTDPGVSALNPDDSNQGTNILKPPVETPNLGVSANHPNPIHGTRLSKMQPQPGSSGSIVKTETPGSGFKSKTPGLGLKTETPGSGVSTKPAPIGTIINQYKRICTIHFRKTFPSFKWQSRFYDRIIRNEKELKNIREYIDSNHQKWKEDNLYQ